MRGQLTSVMAGLMITAVQGFGGPHVATKVLRKPGDCRHEDFFPWSVQCAETKRCLSIVKHVNNTQLDCCGPGNEADCHDHSDEDRYYGEAVAAEMLDGAHHSLEECEKQIPENPRLAGIFQTCSSLKQEFPAKYRSCLHNLIFRCLKTKKCLSRIHQASRDGQCDCCGPLKTCSDCNDHSDEDPCRPGQWPTHFSCDGKCLPIGEDIYLGPLYDRHMDCSTECVEPNPAVQKKCEARQFKTMTSADVREREDDGRMKEFCEGLKRRGTPHFECPSKPNLCLSISAIRNGPAYCPKAEDNDEELHPTCDVDTLKKHCSGDTYHCIKVNKGEFIECRCEKGMETGNNRICRKNGQPKKKA